MPTPSSVVAELPASGIRRMMAKASAMSDVARLDVGEPQFATPAHIVEAACAATRAGRTHYAPSGGLRSTREAIAAALSASGAPATWENVVVTLGAVGALISAVRAVAEPGDEVLVPDPGWPNYQSLTLVSGAVPRRYALAAEHGFEPTRETLEAVVTPRTRAVLVNTPCNPTGAVFSRDTVEGVLAFARDHDLYVISDEVYGKIVYDERPFVSAWGLGEDERVIVANSVSKTYSMTGWRLGWALAEPAAAALIAKLQEAYISCSPTVSQLAVETALAGDQACVAEFREAYRVNLAIAVGELERQGIACSPSAGTFYLWAHVGCDDSWAFADRLLEERRVAVAPGEAFGEQGRGFVRLSLASSEDQVRRGARALAEFCRAGGR